MSTTITPTEQTIDINVTEDVIDINVTNNIVDVNATTEQINIEVAGAYPLPATIASVFGRTGAIVATIGDYNTSLVTENTNLYFTNARARSAISLTTSGTSGAASYDSGTGVLNVPQYQGGVTSFNTRTGAISLTSADVSGALSYVPYNSSNPSGYITGITSGNVISALGYTPYNSSNPNGYISGITSGNVTTALGYTPVTNARTLTINGTTYDLTADRSWTITGGVSSVFGRTGTVVAVSGDYTTTQVTEGTNLYYTDLRSRAALSFVAGSGAYNSTTGVITIPTNNNQITNGAGYITSSALSTYVPYTGATTNLNLGTNNLLANNAFLGFSSLAASGTQLVLTVASAPIYIVTGSGGQTIKLPDATTLPNGANYVFNNNQSSGSVLVNNNSNTLVVSIPSGGYCTLELTDNSIAAGSWDRHFEAPSNVNWSTNTLDYAGSITSATWNGNAIQPNRGGTGQSTYTDGQLLIGNSTGNTLTKANLSAGTGISITNGGGSISIASTITQYTDALARASISLTTTGSSGAATYNSTTGVLNIPQYIGVVTSVFGRTGAVVATEGDYSLTQLSDVTITTPTNGQVLKYNGSAWVNDTDANTGTVTSVGLSAPTGFSVTNSPVTSSGTLTLSFATGYSLPTNSSQTTWDTAYTNRITSLTTTGSSGAATLTSNTLNIPNYTLAGLGGISLTSLSATTPLNYNNTTGVFTITQASASANGFLASGDFTTFNNKQGAITLTTTGTSGAATLVGTTLNIPQYSGGSGMAIGGSITSATAGSVLFAGASGILAQKNANFFWDNTNNLLGLGTTTPSSYYSGADNLVINQASGEAGISIVTASNTSGAIYFAYGTTGDQAYRGGLAYTHSSNLLTFIASGASKMWLNGSGQLGIGTDLIGSKLQVNGNAAIGYSASTAAPTNGLAVSGEIAGTNLISTTYGVARITVKSTTNSANAGFTFDARNSSGTSGQSGLYFVNGTTTATTYLGISADNTNYQLNTLANGNVLIGSTTDVPSAKLVVSTTTQGFLPPVMTTTQKNAIASPATGLVVFDSTLGKLCVFSTTWQTITSV